MGMSNAVDAGQAAVKVGLNDAPFDAGLTRAEARLKAFSASAVAIGTKFMGFGLGIGAGLVGAVKSFANLGTELATINKKLATVDASSAEFASLTKEAERLTRIMGGAEVAAASQLAQKFLSLKDSVRGVIVTFGAGLAPVMSKIIDYVKKAVDGVGDFIHQHKALAPQAAIVTTAIIAAGAAIAALGVSFYVLGPVIRLSMIVASAATLAFSVAMSVAKVVGIGLAVSVKLLSFALAATAIAAKVTAVTLGIVVTITKALTTAIAIQIALTGLWAAGYGAVAKSLNVLYVSTKFGVIAGVLMATMYAAQTVAALAFSAALKIVSAAIALVSQHSLLALRSVLLITAGVLAATVAVIAFADVVQWAFNGAAQLVRTACDRILEAVGGIPQAVSGYMGEVLTVIQSAFGKVAIAARQAFAAAKTLFLDLLGTAKQTFQGISDAVASGNIQLAMDVLWAGLKVSWTKGMDGLKSAWDTSLIYLEGALDNVATSLKMIWDVALASMEGAFDKFATSIRTKMQDITGSLAKFIAKTGIFGKVDDKSIEEENREQKNELDQGFKKREDDRTNRIANAGDEPELKKREQEREEKLAQVRKPSPELEKLNAELAALIAKAAAEKPKPSDATIEAGKAGANAAASAATSVEAHARGSTGAASTIARAVNSAGRNPELAELKLANTHSKEQIKLLTKLTGKSELMFVEVS